MKNFNLLLKINFWIKLGVISWWALVIGTYVWFLGFVGKSPLLGGWLSVVAATLIGGAGFNHMANLYNTSIDNFNVDYVWPAIFMSLGAILLLLGVLFGSLYHEFWFQVASIIFVVIAIIAIVVGSDTAPRDKNA